LDYDAKGVKSVERLLDNQKKSKKTDTSGLKTPSSTKKEADKSRRTASEVDTDKAEWVI